jgi:hypothetical protein
MWFIAYSHHKGIIIWVELESCCNLKLAQQQQQQHLYELWTLKCPRAFFALYENQNEDPLIHGGGKN